MIFAGITPPLEHDPAWLRYQHSFRFLRLLEDFRQGVLAQQRAIADVLRPAIQQAIQAFTEFGQAIAKLNQGIDA